MSQVAAENWTVCVVGVVNSETGFQVPTFPPLRP